MHLFLVVVHQVGSNSVVRQAVRSSSKASDKMPPYRMFPVTSPSRVAHAQVLPDGPPLRRAGENPINCPPNPSETLRRFPTSFMLMPFSTAEAAPPDGNDAISVAILVSCSDGDLITITVSPSANHVGLPLTTVEMSARLLSIVLADCRRQRQREAIECPTPCTVPWLLRSVWLLSGRPANIAGPVAYTCIGQ